VKTCPKTWHLSSQFGPNAFKGDVSQEFVSFIQELNADQEYDSAVAALLCREAYEIGRNDGGMCVHAGKRNHCWYAQSCELSAGSFRWDHSKNRFDPNRAVAVSQYQRL
jgi:hypothetical protein